MLYKLDRSREKPKLVRVSPHELKVEPHRRNVILFPGAGADVDAVFNRPQTIAGSVKYMEQLLSSSRSYGKEPVDIYIFVYPESFQEMQRSGIHDKDAHFTMASTSADFTPVIFGHRGMRAVLTPLLLEKGETWAAIKPEMLKERLSRMTMCGHSFGGVMIQHVADALAFTLREAGWQEQTIAETMKELVSVTVAGVGRVDYPAPNFTQFHFQATNDIGAFTSIRRDMPEGADYATMLDQCGYWRAAEVVRDEGVTEPSEALVQQIKERVLSKRPKRNDLDDSPKPIWRARDSGYSIHGLLPDDEVRWIERKRDGTQLCRVLLAKPDEHNPNAGTNDGSTPIQHDFRNFMHGDHHMGDVLINVMNNAVQRDVGIGDGHQLGMSTEMTRPQHGMRRDDHETAAVSQRGILSR